MPTSHRRLPHHHPGEKWLFVTCHLHGSLPQAKYPPPGKLNSGAAFVWMDRYLDTARTGPMYLARESVAKAIAGSLQRGVLLGHYDLGAPGRSCRITSTCCCCQRLRHPACCNL
jgi:hypothetical protein